jgi:hypothetical protein
VRLLSGALDEELFARDGGERPLWRLKAQRMSPETVTVAVEAIETIHRNENATAAPAISLHLYSPPLQILNSFDEESGARHEVRVDGSAPVAVGGNPRIVPVR